MSIRINGVERPSTTAEYSNQAFDMHTMWANPNIYEPQRTTDFEFVLNFVDFNGNPINLSANGLTWSSEQAQEILRLAVVQCNIPHYSIEPIVERRGNTVQKFAGLPTFNNGQITVRDWIGANTKDILQAWQKLAVNMDTGKTGLMSDYKFTGHLLEYTPDRQLIRTWKLYGVWVSSIEEEPYNHENEGGARAITATLEYDHAEIESLA